MDDVTNMNGEGNEGNVSQGRPTLFGTQHGSRLFCAHCGAHNAPGWASCSNCGARRPTVSNGHRYAAALGAAMVSAVTFLMMWRLAQVPATCIVVAPPPPPVTSVMVTSSGVVISSPGVTVCTGPMEESSEEMTVLQPYPGGTVTSYTCRTGLCTGTVYTRTVSGVNGQIVEYRRDTVEETGPAIVAPPIERDSSAESFQPVQVPTDVVVATTGGNRR